MNKKSFLVILLMAVVASCMARAERKRLINDNWQFFLTDESTAGIDYTQIAEDQWRRVTLPLVLRFGHLLSLSRRTAFPGETISGTIVIDNK